MGGELNSVKLDSLSHVSVPALIRPLLSDMFVSLVYPRGPKGCFPSALHTHAPSAHNFNTTGRFNKVAMVNHPCDTHTRTYCILCCEHL